MARIDTLLESNGPDRFNLTPGCYRHHAGIRTGITDYCCCCDPCQYVRKNEGASDPDDRSCCRCSLKIILAKFAPSESSASDSVSGSDEYCCRSLFDPMIARISAVGGVDTMTYSGSIVGHPITVYISNRSMLSGSMSDSASNSDSVSSSESLSASNDGTCFWTILIPSLGVEEEFVIDHTIVTCLGVPAVSIENVIAFESCVGTVSLFNYTTVKLPFRVRDYGSDSDDIEELTVPFPDGFECEGCTSLPRYICVTKKHNHENRVRSPRIPWEIEWWRDFSWDYDFEPYYTDSTSDSASFSGSDSNEDGEFVVGRWWHQPKDQSAFLQHIYLIQDIDGVCWLQPDFAAPSGTKGEGEFWRRTLFSGCGCQLKALDVRPINDPSPPSVPGQTIAEDLLGIDFRAGRCGCWDYYCGKRRCVPRWICGFVFVGGTVYRNILFTWKNSLKQWVSSGGEKLDGSEMPFSLSLSLEENEDGECQITVVYEDFELNAFVIGSYETIFSGTIQGKNAAGDDYFSLNISTSFDGDCKLLVTCGAATPCAENCGSHPNPLFLKMRGFSLPSDIPPPPVTGECITNFELAYYQTIIVTGSSILTNCGYVGYAIVDGLRFDPATSSSSPAVFLIKAELSMGSLRITRRWIEEPDVILFSETMPLQVETCDPYYGYFFATGSLRSCFFGDNRIIWHRYEAEITE
jgi:hypothetical protein